MNISVKRAGNVVNVLFKYGLGYFVHELGLRWHLPFFKKLGPTGRQPKDLPAKLCKAMEDLGGAYLKLGQFLALRPDLLPIEYCDEFKKLLDKVTPMPYSKVHQVLETSLKASVNTFFKHIEQKPIGSASIAQVHEARLKSGKKVVIKVQRPDAKETFAADIQIMYYLARKLEKRFGDRAISPSVIVEEFERYTKQELNFVFEARNIDRFSKHFKKSRTVAIPEVYWPATTAQVLTMEQIEGKPLTEVLTDHQKHHLLAQRIADASFEQIFKLGLFHADMHPGNIIVMPDNKIGLLDFGIVGSLNDELIKNTLAIYTALVNKDADGVTKVMLKVGNPEPDADVEGFKLEVESIVNAWYGTTVGQARVTNMMQSLFESAVKHKIKMPINFILLGKAMVTVEGTCIALDPDFNFVTYSQPKVMKLLKKYKHPKAVLTRFGKLSQKYASLLADIPEQTSAVLERVKKGSIDLKIKETDVKHLGMDLNRSSNRLSYALIIAALLVSGAILVDVPPKFGAYSIFTVIVLFFAAFLLMMLLVSVWREGNPPFDPHKKETSVR